MLKNLKKESKLAYCASLILSDYIVKPRKIGESGTINIFFINKISKVANCKQNLCSSKVFLYQNIYNSNKKGNIYNFFESIKDLFIIDQQIIILFKQIIVFDLLTRVKLDLADDLLVADDLYDAFLANHQLALSFRQT